MPRNPEVNQSTLSFTETGRFLLGVIARNPLRLVIIEAEGTRKSIDPQKKENLKYYFAYRDYKDIIKVYADLRLAWQREKATYLPDLDQLEKKTTGKKERLLNQKIINPLCEIYIEIEGEEPNSSEPWLGKLLIDAALEKEGTEEVRSFLSQFGLNPKDLVEEVYQYLDRDLKKR